MPRYTLSDKRTARYEYKVHAVTAVEEELLNNMAEEWYELDYVIAKDTIPVIYLVFRRYTDNE